MATLNKILTFDQRKNHDADDLSRQQPETAAGTGSRGEEAGPREQDVDEASEAFSVLPLESHGQEEQQSREERQGRAPQQEDAPSEPHLRHMMDEIIRGMDSAPAELRRSMAAECAAATGLQLQAVTSMQLTSLVTQT